MRIVLVVLLQGLAAWKRQTSFSAQRHPTGAVLLGEALSFFTARRNFFSAEHLLMAEQRHRKATIRARLMGPDMSARLHLIRLERLASSPCLAGLALCAFVQSPRIAILAEACVEVYVITEKLTKDFLLIFFFAMEIESS